MHMAWVDNQIDTQRGRENQLGSDAALGVNATTTGNARPSDVILAQRLSGGIHIILYSHS